MSIFLRVATFAACAVGAGAVCAQSLGEIAGGAAANATGSAQSAQQAQQQSAAEQPLGQAAGAQSGEAKKTDASAAAAHTPARVGQQLAAGAKNSVSESELESLFLKASKGDAQAQLKLAQAGDADAMYEVYRKFLSGKGGFLKSIPRAVFWLRNAADRGHRRSMELLASMYIEGRFVGKDFSRGVSMLETLAKTDPVFAVRLSNVYSEDGEHKDVQKASMWLDRAAEKLDGINKIHLVWKVWAGSGVLRDTAKASKYCDDIIAAEKSAGLKALAEKIKKSIADGVPAPANFGDLYK